MVRWVCEDCGFAWGDLYPDEFTENEYDISSNCQRDRDGDYADAETKTERTPT